MKADKQLLSMQLAGETVTGIVKQMRRKSLRVSVDDHGDLDIRVPFGCSKRVISQFVKTHENWLIQRRTAVLKGLSSKSQRITLLGQEFEVVPADTNMIELSEGGIRVPEFWSAQQCSEKLGIWLREHARAFFKDRIDHWWPSFQHLSATQPVLRVKVMKTRWGSLSTRGYINLNRSLIHLPPEFIDLVVVHELCHLKYFDHGPGFQALMREHIPNVQVLNKRLNQFRFTGYSLEN